MSKDQITFSIYRASDSGVQHNSARSLSEPSGVLDCSQRDKRVCRIPLSGFISRGMSARRPSWRDHVETSSWNIHGAGESSFQPPVRGPSTQYFIVPVPEDDDQFLEHVEFTFTKREGFLDFLVGYFKKGKLAFVIIVGICTVIVYVLANLMASFRYDDD